MRSQWPPGCQHHGAVYHLEVAQQPILTVYLGNTVSIVCDISLGSIPTLISRFLGSIAVGDFWPRRADHNSNFWRVAVCHH